MAALSTLALGALTGLTAVSGASSYFGQRKQADAAQAQGDYEARMLGQNADLADQQAGDAIARGTLAEQQVRSQTRGAVGSARVGAAAQGIDTTVGSAGDIAAQTKSAGEFDAMTTKLNAAREAWGFTTEAQNYRNQAVLRRAGAANQAGAMRTAATGTLLTTATNLYGQSRSWSRGSGASASDVKAAAKVGRDYANTYGRG